MTRILLSMVFVLFLFLFASLFPSFAQTNCANADVSQAECEALVALYYSTDGENWRNLRASLTWLKDSRVCNWTGVTCSNSQIVELELSNSNLSGVIPSEIGNLIHLKHLLLDSNRLTSLPAEIGNLTNLEFLRLVGNPLESVPIEVGDLSNLIFLDLSGIPFTSLPHELGNLTNLQGFWLLFSQSTSIPDWIGNLTNLKVLNLQRNQLTSIPDWIGNLNDLQSLGLSNNQLTLLPETIVNLTNLQYLSISDNALDRTTMSPALQEFVDRLSPGWEESQTITSTVIATPTLPLTTQEVYTMRESDSVDLLLSHSEEYFIKCDSYSCSNGAMQLSLHKLDSGELLYKIDFDANISRLEFSQDDSRILVATEDDVVKILETSSGRLLHEINARNGIWNSKEDLILGKKPSDSTTVAIWEIRSGDIIYEVSANYVPTAIWHPNGTQFAVYAFRQFDNNISVYDVPSQSLAFKFPVFEVIINHVNWSDNGNYIVVASGDGMGIRNEKRFTHIHDGKNGQLLYAIGLINLINGPFTVPFNLGDRQALSFEDSEIAVVDAETGTELFRLLHDGNLRGARWNSDGTKVLSWAGDATAHLWTITNSEATNTLTLNHDLIDVADAQFSDDETLIMTHSRVLRFDEDEIYKFALWDAVSGEQLVDIIQPGGLLGYTWTTDGSRFISWGREDIDDWDSDTVIRVWEMLPATDLIVDAQLPDEGSIAVEIYCQAKGFQDANYIQGDAYSWECNDESESVSINFQQACREVYGDARPFATLGSAIDQFGWKCELNEGYVAPPLGTIIARISTTVRSGPSISYGGVGAILEGEPINVVGVNASKTWVEITFGLNQLRWICADHVEVADLSYVKNTSLLPKTDNTEFGCWESHLTSEQLNLSDGSEVGVIRDIAEIVYINGIRTSYEDFFDNLLIVSEAFGNPQVMGIYNATENTWLDAWQASNDRDGGIGWNRILSANPVVDTLVKILNNLDKPIILVGHSQGTAIISAALETLKSQDYDKFDLVTVYTFATVARTYEAGPTFVHCVHRGDTLSEILSNTNQLGRIPNTTISTPRIGEPPDYLALSGANHMFFNYIESYKQNRCPRLSSLTLDMPKNFDSGYTAMTATNTLNQAQIREENGIHVSIYCQEKGYTEASFTGGDAYSWQCVSPTSVLQIDFQQACQEVYGKEKPYAILADTSDHYGWQCSETAGYVAPENTTNADSTTTQQLPTETVSTAVPPVVEVCPGALPARLVIGQQAQQALTNDPVRVQDQPGGGTTLFFAYPGDVVEVVGGPECYNVNASPATWWQIRGVNDWVGWIAEGVNGKYFFEPVE